MSKKSKRSGKGKKGNNSRPTLVIHGGIHVTIKLPKVPKIKIPKGGFTGRGGMERDLLGMEDFDMPRNGFHFPGREGGERMTDLMSRFDRIMDGPFGDPIRNAIFGGMGPFGGDETHCCPGASRPGGFSDIEEPARQRRCACGCGCSGQPAPGAAAEGAERRVSAETDTVAEMHPPAPPVASATTSGAESEQ